LADPAGMEILVNGESMSIAAGATIADLLRQLGLDHRRVAVELNLQVVPRAEHSARHLSPGDRLEIVTFVGGGAC
jgi:sulfur carrier protein